MPRTTATADVNAGVAIADVRTRLAGEPVYLAGSLVASEAYGKTDAWSDVDIFCPTPFVLIAVAEKLLHQGFTLDDRFSRTLWRWKRQGMKGWHTNSLRMQAPGGTEWNLVYKMHDGHPTTSLSQVLESFDFGLLGMGWDLELDEFRDLRPYLFADLCMPQGTFTVDPTVALPMMPAKRANWRGGFISQYNGLREAGRYAKYAEYGYDLTLVRDDLVTGYRQAWLYYSNAFEKEKQQLGAIYSAIADHIDANNIAELRKATKLIDYSDALDVIMAALE